jgi:hypothetical protein
MRGEKIYTAFSTAWTTRESGVRFLPNTENFFFYGTSYPTGAGAFSLWKTASSEADRLHSSGAEIKRDGVVSTFPLHVYGVVLN